MHRSQVFWRSISIFLSLSFLNLPFLSSYWQFCYPLYRLSFTWNCELWLVNFLGKAKANLQRVVGKQQNWHWIFPQNVTFFCECNSVRIGQNIQNKASLEIFIFADVIVYRFINLNWTLSGSRKENMHRSIWNVNDQSNLEGLKCALITMATTFNTWIISVKMMYRTCRIQQTTSNRLVNHDF